MTAAPDGRPPWRRAPTTLVPLTRVHAVNAAADALIAVSLADTFFFDVPLGQARERVALYLLVTVAPFAVVAPVIGPLLDRARSGRRYAIATAMAGRALLAWFMAGGSGGLRLYPAAFAILVLSKGYGVAKAAAVPRLQPPDLSLVKANARLSATAVVSGMVAAVLGAGLSQVTDYRWTLRVAAIVFAVAAALALRLPAAVNTDAAGSFGTTPAKPPRFTGRVRWALLAAASLRAFSGFLTMFLAFLLRQADEGAGGAARLGLVIAAAAVGGLVGTGLGAQMRERSPDLLLGASLGLAALGAAVAASSFSLGTAALVALVSGLGGSLGKLAYDSVLQHEIDEHVRGQVFARSETTLQLAWVVGGVVGIALPLEGGLGLGLAAAALVTAPVVAGRGLRSTSPAG